MFCEENYSAFPNKINKDNFRKNHKKNHFEKYCIHSVSTEKVLEKKYKKTGKKNHVGNTIAIHSVL
jgi:hypothetical protein